MKSLKKIHVKVRISCHSFRWVLDSWLSYRTKDNKECTSGTHDFLVRIRQKSVSYKVLWIKLKSKTVADVAEMITIHILLILQFPKTITMYKNVLYMYVLNLVLHVSTSMHKYEFTLMFYWLWQVYDIITCLRVKKVIILSDIHMHVPMQDKNFQNICNWMQLLLRFINISELNLISRTSWDYMIMGTCT